MITARDFVEGLREHDTGSFIGVPCSILKPVFNYLMDKGIPLELPASEAVAMGIASGSYMGSGKVPVIMMQNSGFCNTTNALTSLNQIYDIPVLYVVTWRGFEGWDRDAPEHNITGRDLPAYLKAFRIPYEVLKEAHYKEQVSGLMERIKETGKPAAIVLKRGVIEPYESEDKQKGYPLSRLDAITAVKETLGEGAVYISSNGFPSRDSFYARESPDFYMMGSMGHALPMGIGVSKHTARRVVVLDGDGSALMHLGSMASVKGCRNLVHVILDNQAYDSTGGQPTLSPDISWASLGKSLGFRHSVSVRDEESLKGELEGLPEGPSMLHVLINRQNERKAKRVSDAYTCPEIKERFMKELR